MNIIYNQEKSTESSYGIIELWDTSNLVWKMTGNLTEFLTWLIDAREFILNDQFFYGSENKSLAMRINMARDIEFNEEMGSDNLVADYWHEQIFDYYKNHCVVFGARGFDNQNIIIGKNLGDGEFSCYNDGNEILKYQFNLEEFYKVVVSKYKEINE